MTYQGDIRSQIEALRIGEGQRGIGIGEKMLLGAIERSKKRGAHLLQLTTDKNRLEALKFYEKIGFQATHEGMKLIFNAPLATLLSDYENNPSLISNIR